MIVAKIANLADGIEAEVMQVGDGQFSVSLWDTDANQRLRAHRIFSTLALAMAYAKRIAAVS